VKKSVEKAIELVDWDEFIETICESWKQAMEELRSFGSLWTREFAKQAEHWLQMTEEEKKQAWLNYILEREGE